MGSAGSRLRASQLGLERTDASATQLQRRLFEAEETQLMQLRNTVAQLHTQVSPSERYNGGKSL